MRRQITEKEKERCYQFARTIIKGGDQFNRFNQNEKTQINRTYIGKLGEYLFLKMLHANGVNYEEGDMFEIFAGKENADTYDFKTWENKTVDIKTASLPFHQRIMVPLSQFHLKKDYYVGIKLNFYGIENGQIKPALIKDCDFCGYIDRASLEKQPTQHFGEGPCKAFKLKDLKPMEELVELF